MPMLIVDLKRQCVLCKAPAFDEVRQLWGWDNGEVAALISCARGLHVNQAPRKVVFSNNGHGDSLLRGLEEFQRRHAVFLASAGRNRLSLPACLCGRKDVTSDGRLVRINFGFSTVTGAFQCVQCGNETWSELGLENINNLTQTLKTKFHQ